MSVAVQTSFLPTFQADLRASLGIFQTSGVHHAFFHSFVRSLAVSYKSAAPGATIVAACPGGKTCSEIIANLEFEIREIEKASYQSPSDFRAIEISVPGRFTHRQLESELISRYFHRLYSAPIGHRGQTRWDDPEFANFNALTQIGRLVCFLRTKKPSLIIIRDAENLRWPGASDDEIRAAWRFIRDIARQSGIPHLICAPVSVVNKFVCKDPTMLAEMQVEVLKPYHKAEGGMWDCFGGVLYDCDQALPWTAGETLTAHIDEIDDAVAGDIDRLRQWVLCALNHALMEPETERISWRHFREKKPQSSQRKLAGEERTLAWSLVDPKDKWAEAELAAKTAQVAACPKEARPAEDVVVQMPESKKEPESPTLMPRKPGDRARARHALMGTEVVP